MGPRGTEQHGVIQVSQAIRQDWEQEWDLQSSSPDLEAGLGRAWEATFHPACQASCGLWQD